MVLRKKINETFVSREGERANFKIIESILYSFAIVTLAMWVFLVASVQAKTNDEPAVSNVVFDTTNMFVVRVDSEIQAINPGESKVQKEAREKAEAETKARAEADAKAQAEDEAKAKAESAVKVTYTSKSTSGSYGDPNRFDNIYKRAEAVYGVDWRILRSIHYVETGQSGSTSKSSYAGAVGPMQFLPSTWNRYGVDGSGDGVAQITNVEDAIFGAANYLRACGYPNVSSALWGYNPSSAYFRKVMSVANSLGFYA